MVKFVLLLALLFIAYLVFKKATSPRIAMSPSDARALLGVSAEADVDQIRDAHRRLIAKVHPDSGGSAELAARVNLARDTLMREVGQASP